MPSRSSINTRTIPCPTSELLRNYGYPTDKSLIGNTDTPMTSKFWLNRTVTIQSHDKFKTRGNKHFVLRVKACMDVIKVKDYELYQAIGSAGSLVVRWVRGAEGVLSNHGLGFAQDFTINGVLDPRGDNMVQTGMLELYKYLKDFDLFWGAGFRIEDAMHAELSGHVVHKRIKEGRF